MAVLPEDMNKTNPSNPEEAIRIIDQYIRYMGERIEFSFSQMTKNISAAGISSAEVYILITAMNQQISAMQSTINNIVGRLNGIESSIVTINGNISTMQGTLQAIQGDITSLDERVTALEQRQ